MARLNGFLGNIIDTLGSYLQAKAGYFIYVFRQGGNVATNSSGTTLSLRSGDGAGFTNGDYIQIGTDSSTVRLISSGGGTDTLTLASAVSAVAGQRVLNLGTVLPVAGVYDPHTSGNSGSLSTIYTEDNSAATAVANSKLTTDADGDFAFYSTNAQYDLLIQDSNKTNLRILAGINIGQVINVNIPVISVTDYGAVGDGTTDDTAAIQGAIDAANAILEADGSFGGAFVLFPVGIYSITSTLLWKRGAFLRGAGIGPYHTTHVRWDGAAGGTMIQDSGTVFSARLLEGIGWRKGTNTPATILSMSGNLDWSCRIQNCNFLGATGDLVKVTNGWINLHMRDVRFDEVGGYALHLTTGAGQNGSTFLLDGFTFDSSGRAGSGFLLFDNDTNNVSNAGTAMLANGRIEITGTAMNDPSGIVTFKVPAAAANPRFIQFNARNVFYQDSAASSNDSFLRCLGATADPASFIIENCHQTGLASVLGGTWTSGVSVPLTNRLLFTAHGEAANLTVVDDTLYFQNFDGSYTPVKMFIGTEAQPRMTIDSAGKHSWGGGAGAVDVTLYRSAADILKSDDEVRSSFMSITDGVTAPGTDAGFARIYVDTADGDLKIKFGDGTVKTIVVDT